MLFLCVRNVGRMFVLELFSNRDLFSPDAKDVELLSFDVIYVIK